LERRRLDGDPSSDAARGEVTRDLRVPVALSIIGALIIAALVPVTLGELVLIGLLVGTGLMLGAIPRAPHIRSASVLYLLTGLAQLIGVAETVVYIAENGEHPLRFPGVRGLAGPFDALGVDAVVALGILFVGLGAIELIVAILLWRARRPGGLLAGVLYLPSLLFWIGFGLPGWLVVGPARMALVARGWRTLR
jgi:hypothetical protein